jgi:hypothetical protein
VPALLVKVTRAWEIAATAEVTHAVAKLAVETYAQETIAVRDSTTLCVKDAENRTALADREALERVSRVEAENATALASSCEDAEGLAQKIALLEDELAVEHRAREVSERER